VSEPVTDEELVAAFERCVLDDENTGLTSSYTDVLRRLVLDRMTMAWLHKGDSSAVHRRYGGCCTPEVVTKPGAPSR
jgi:hypothetical protein